MRNEFYSALVDELEKIAKTRWVKRWEKGKLGRKALERIAGRSAKFPKKLPKKSAVEPAMTTGMRDLDRGDILRSIRQGRGPFKRSRVVHPEFK